MAPYLAITAASLVTAAVALRGWRKARGEVNEFRSLYWTAMGALRDTTHKCP